MLAMALRSKLVPVLAAVVSTALLGAAACRTGPASHGVTSAVPDAAASSVVAFTPEAGETPTGKLVAFETEQDFDAYMEAWRDQEKRKQEARRRPFPMKSPPGDAGPPELADDGFAAEQAAPKKSAPAAPAPRAGASAAESKSKKSESITNNQNANVDEGDIVKLHGQHLVVLRRGRLFTLALDQAAARPSATVDAFGPGIDPRGTWYDEMLVDGDTVVVIGFSYARGGTEIGIFHIDARGGLQYRSTHHLRSNDYYSSRNYASRIVDGHLVFYTPTYLSANDDPRTSDRWPAVRRWRTGVQPTDFARTLRSNRLYHLEDELPPTSQSALHTVTSCDLRAPQLTCDSVGMMGPPGRVFYVSDSNVYVWMREWSNFDGNGHPPGILAKIPLSPNQNLTAIRVTGMPTDQFSFDEADGHLNVLVRSESNGDAMFASETTETQEPETYTCDRFTYGDGAVCDCGCGAFDPDCASAAVAACDSCSACGTARCELIVSAADNAQCIAAPPVPAGWACNPVYWADGQCDCACGALDVDCGAAATPAACDYCAACDPAAGVTCSAVVTPDLLACRP